MLVGIAGMVLFTPVFYLVIQRIAGRNDDKKPATD
jgi:hypothetical protein